MPRSFRHVKTRRTEASGVCRAMLPKGITWLVLEVLFLLRLVECRGPSVDVASMLEARACLRAGVAH